MKQLSVKCKTIQELIGSTDECLYDFGSEEYISKQIPKARKKKVDRYDIKMKESFLHIR